MKHPVDRDQIAFQTLFGMTYSRSLLRLTSWPFWNTVFSSFTRAHGGRHGSQGYISFVDEGSLSQPPPLLSFPIPKNSPHLEIINIPTIRIPLQLFLPYKHSISNTHTHTHTHSTHKQACRGIFPSLLFSPLLFEATQFFLFARSLSLSLSLRLSL